MNNSSLGKFGRLPAEVRNEIFRTALTAKNPITIECHTRLFSREGASMLYPTKAPFVLRGYIIPKSQLAIKGSVRKGLGAGIVLACRTMHREAIAMLYHGNTFVLESVLAIGWFLHTIGGNVKALTRIDSSAAQFIDHARQLMPVRRMVELEYIGVGAVILRGKHRDWMGCDAATLAQKTWKIIEPIVAYREEETETNGGPLSTDLIELSTEEQVQRLDIFHFEVSWKTSFEDQAGGSTRISDADGRRQRFKELMVDHCISQGAKDQSRVSVGLSRATIALCRLEIVLLSQSGRYIAALLAFVRNIIKSNPEIHHQQHHRWTMYLFDIIIIILCKLAMALLVSGHEGSEKQQPDLQIDEYVLHSTTIEQSVDGNSSKPSKLPSADQRPCKPSSLGTLETLPAEIRNQIYQHVLQAPEAITIRRRRQWPRNQPFARRFDTRSIYNAGKPRFCVEGSVDSKHRRQSVDKCVNMGLLQVSKTIGGEAAGILFRRNLFVFKDRLALTEFGNKVGRLYAASLVDLPLKEVEGGRMMLGFE